MKGIIGDHMKETAEELKRNLNGSPSRSARTTSATQTEYPKRKVKITEPNSTGKSLKSSFAADSSNSEK